MAKKQKQKKPVILIGAKGFWEARKIVKKSVFRDAFDLVFANDFSVADAVKKEVIAIVVADQPVDAALMDEFPNLRTIARTGTGYDNIDVKSAHERNIIISRVAELNAEPVSEFALGLMLALIRNIVGVHQKMCVSKWDRYKGMLVSELTVGLVGLGAIGRSLARKLHALGVKKLIGWNRTRRPQVENTVLNSHLELMDLEKVMKESDVIIVALALAPETKHLISADMLSRMKKTAYLINVSRGAIVDENALAETILSDKIAGAALDVFSLEPPSGNPFPEPFMRKLVSAAKNGGNVILSPHYAGITRDSVRNISLQVAKNITGVLSGKTNGLDIV